MSAAEKTAEPAPASPAPTPAKGNGLAIAALIVGIVAVLSGWVPFWGFVVGAAAIILGIIGLKKAGQKGMSIAGIITGAVGALWSLIVTVFFILAIVAVGFGGIAATSGLSQELASQQAKADAKKDFSKGETATFGDFEVKVNGVTEGFQATDGFSTPDEGKQFIVVNLTVKNIDDTSQYISQFDFDVAVNGVAETASYVDADPAFDAGEVLAGGSVIGNIVYEVPVGASDMKLTYDTYGYDNGEFKLLTYTLEI